MITVGVRARGNARAAALGLAAACGYALTATLMKSAVAALAHGVGPFFSSWQLYATAAAGVGALFLLQNGLQAGSLVAVQPPLTLGDALISASYGVTVFGESVQTGGWLLAVQIVAVIAVAVGCIELSRSLAMVHGPQPGSLPAELPSVLAVCPRLSGCTGSPGTFTSLWKNAAMSIGIRTQPCETGCERHVRVAVDRERGADEEHRVVHLAERHRDPAGQERQGRGSCRSA